MTSNYKEFEKALLEAEQKVRKAITVVIKDVVNEAYNALLEPKSEGGTPKLTGHLRSNYITTIDSKFEGVIGSPKNVETSTRDAAIIDFNETQDFVGHSWVYISNNVDYGLLVNTQQRFFEASIERARGRIKMNREIKI